MPNRSGNYEAGHATVARNREREQRQEQAKKAEVHAAIQDSKRRI